MLLEQNFSLDLVSRTNKIILPSPTSMFCGHWFSQELWCVENLTFQPKIAWRGGGGVSRSKPVKLFHLNVSVPNELVTDCRSHIKSCLTNILCVVWRTVVGDSIVTGVSVTLRDFETRTKIEI